MSFGNETVTRGEEHLHRALRREKGQPLITVSNHVASIDDPVVTATLVPSSLMLHPSNVRCVFLSVRNDVTAIFVMTVGRSVQRTDVFRAKH